MSMHDETTIFTFSLPVFEEKAGAGRRKQVGAKTVTLTLTAEDKFLAVRFATLNAWKAIEGWAIQESRIRQALISYWKSEKELSPMKALTQELCRAYGVETPKELPAAPVALIAAIAGGEEKNSPRLLKACHSLTAKFPNVDWVTVINNAVEAQGKMLQDLEF